MSKQPVLKAGDLIEACLECGNDLLYVEMPNGHRIPIIHYHHARNKRGQDILVLHAGNNRRVKP